MGAMTSFVMARPFGAAISRGIEYFTFVTGSHRDGGGAPSREFESLKAGTPILR
jgi:hypothetical protein